MLFLSKKRKRQKKEHEKEVEKERVKAEKAGREPHPIPKPETFDILSETVSFDRLVTERSYQGGIGFHNLNGGFIESSLAFYEYLAARYNIKYPTTDESLIPKPKTWWTTVSDIDNTPVYDKMNPDVYFTFIKAPHIPADDWSGVEAENAVVDKDGAVVKPAVKAVAGVREKLGLPIETVQTDLSDDIWKEKIWPRLMGEFVYMDSYFILVASAIANLKGAYITTRGWVGAGNVYRQPNILLAGSWTNKKKKCLISVIFLLRRGCILWSWTFQYSMKKSSRKF